MAKLLTSTPFIGVSFSRLTVIGMGAPRQGAKQRSSTWRCRCMCGSEIDVLPSRVRHGKVKSCGCLYAETRESNLKHGKSRDACIAPEYRAWQSMKSRCNRKTDIRYQNYGGRGIAVCDRWMNGDGIKSGVECFLIDMGDRPAGHTIDRIDNDGDYTPSNVRWATYSEQNSNRRPYTRRKSIKKAATNVAI